MKFLKKYKWLLIIIVLLIILGILAYYLFFMLYNDSSVYGNRLQGITKNEIKEDLKNDIINNLTKNDEIKEAHIDIKGKIVNIVTNMKENAELDEVKLTLESILNKFSEEQLNYYDLQFYITWEENEERIPCMGYKSKKNTFITWNKSS
ncbi:MAG: hypothetical protein PHY26_00645 [Bacilli bacterium]|jgi:hypothetical protein|nr:hypothetical protein [Bacilli bacterium]